MSETNRTRRSPQEILAAKEADLANAKARAAVDAQMNHPLIADLSGLIVNLSKERTDAKKGWNGNPAQTFANRRQSHELWLDEIQAEQEKAVATISLVDYIGPKYRSLRNEIATSLANGLSAESASVALEAGENFIRESALSLYVEVENAKGNLAIAKAARKAFIEGKGKAQAQQEATA